MQEGTIRIERRDNGRRDRLRAYKVVLDGAEVGELRRGESISVRAAPGSHRLRLRIDWTGSEEVAFDLGPDQIVDFACQPRPQGLSVADLLTRQPWIDLGWASDLDARRYPESPNAAPVDDGATVETARASAPMRVRRAYRYVLQRESAADAEGALAALPTDQAVAWLRWAGAALTPLGRIIRRRDLAASVISGGLGRSAPPRRGAMLGQILGNWP